jgi:hypothetical protein
MHRSSRWLLPLLALASSASSPALAFEPPPPGPSLFGYTGLLEIPSAEVVTEGWTDLMLSTAREARFREQPGQTTFTFATGLVPFVEIGARLAEVESPRGYGFLIRDLSFNAKLQLPLQRLHPWLPALALGAQDIGGSASHYETAFVAASLPTGPARWTVGYGRGPDRLEGLFGGLELQALPGLTLLGEYADGEFQAGARLALRGTVAGVPMAVGAIGRTRLAYRPGTFEGAVTLSFPLALGLAQPDAPDAALGAVAMPLLEGEGGGGALRDALVAQGFQDVRVGRAAEGAELVVELENNVFNHDELDGLGVALGLAAQHAPEGADRVALRWRKGGAPVGTVRAPLGVLRESLLGSAPLPAEALELEVGRPSDDGVAWDPSAPGRPSLLTVQGLVGPRLAVFLGTELSPLEVMVALRPEVRVRLWPGATAQARWDIPVAWTKGFGEGQPFQTQRNPPIITDATLAQAFSPSRNVVVLAQAGLFRIDAVGGLLDAAWMPGDGSHRLRAQGALARGVLRNDTVASAVASYRYYFGPLNASAELRAGRFLSGDVGGNLELARFFGDTRLALSYSHTTLAKYAAIELTLPLTPRRDLTPGRFQVRGDPRGGLRLGTVVASGRNNVTFGVALLPEGGYGLQEALTNSDRWSTAYLRTHRERLRDAFRALTVPAPAAPAPASPTPAAPAP